jgi:predicted 3-demethylubiquinone-9 3-methyltransferase (glyoxalase superfamily)
MQKITPHLWFATEAEEAARLYVSVFSAAPNAAGVSTLGKTMRYGKEGFEIHKMPEGTVMTIEFTLADQKFIALNGGPIFKFNESVSFLVDCESQEEVDHYWSALSASPENEQCGWLKDKFGLSWQIVPKRLNELMSDPKTSGAVMNAMLQMKKLDIAGLEKAAAQS